MVRCDDGPEHAARVAGRRAAAWQRGMGSHRGQLAPGPGTRGPAVRLVCRHPVILASIARHLIHGSVEGARAGYRTVRTELAEDTPPHALDVALKAYRDRRAPPGGR